MQNLPNERLVLTSNAIKRHTRRLQNEVQELFKNYKDNQIEDFNLSSAQNLFSRVLGMKDYHEMNKVLFNQKSVEEQKTSNQKLEEENIKIEESIKNFVMPSRLIKFDDLLHNLLRVGNVTNIAIQTQESPSIEINNRSYFITDYKFSQNDMQRFAINLYKSEEIIAKLSSGKDINMVYNLRLNRDETVMFYVNVTSILVEGHRGYSIYLKKINNTIKNINEIIYNEELKNNLDIHSGIVLNCGSAKSIKQEILHSFLQDKIKKVNKKFAVYQILSEFKYNVENSKSSIFYVQVGNNIATIPDAIRNAKNRNIDYAFVEEIRSNEDLKELIETSSAGTRIYTTMSSVTLESTLNRLLKIIGKNNKEDYLELLQEMSLIIQNHDIVENDNTITIQSYLKLTDHIKSKIEDFLNNHEIQSFPLYIKELVNKHAFTYEDALDEALEKKLISPITHKKYLEMYQ